MNREYMALRLKELRGNQSQAEVARAIGVSPSAYAMYETGKRVPRDDVKIRISKHFNRSVKNIFFETNAH